MSTPHARTSRARDSISRVGMMGHIPPPPAGPSLASRQMMPEPDLPPQSQPAAKTPSKASPVYPFDAELEMAEIDERGKAGIPWSARARTLSRSGMTVSSRRMCHTDRRVLIAVHRVDDEPAVLLARVADCRYETDGLHLLELELLPMTDAGTPLTFTRRAGSA
jgi:hypothetical protein